VSHSDALVRELGVVDPDGDPDGPDEADEAGAGAVGLGSPARGITLVKDLGETFVEGQGLLSTPPWTWGTRR
jgi:hypothetical protein